MKTGWASIPRHSHADLVHVIFVTENLTNILMPTPRHFREYRNSLDKQKAC